MKSASDLVDRPYRSYISYMLRASHGALWRKPAQAEF